MTLYLSYYAINYCTIISRVKKRIDSLILTDS